MKKIAISLLVLALVAAFSATGVVSAQTWATTTSATTTSAQCTSCTTAASCCPSPVVTCCPVVTTCVVTKCSEVKTVAVAKAGGVSAAGGIGTQATSTTQSIGAITQNNYQIVNGNNNSNITFAPQSNTADPTNANVPVNVVVKDIIVKPFIAIDAPQFNNNRLNNSTVA